MTYEIKILTPAGPKTVYFTEGNDLAAFEADLTKEYGSFITLQSNPLKP